MAAPSYANGVTLTKAAVNRLQKLELFANSASPNFDDLNDTLLAANLYDNQDLVAADAAAMRKALSDMLSPAAVRQAIRGALTEWAIACGAPEGAAITLPQALSRIRDYMVANSKSLNAREFTRGAASAGGSNVGNGAVKRLTVDEDGFALEGSHAETKTLRCDFDQLSVPKHKERFTVEGATAERDFIEVLGSGIVSGDGATDFLQCLTSDDSLPYLDNPTFSTFSGTQPTAGSETTPTATDSVTGWTLGNTAGARVSLDQAYRDFPTESQKYSVRFTADNSLTQTFNTKNRTVPRKKPMYVQVAIYRKDAATGTLTITVGAQSQNFTIGSLANNAWNLCVLDLDKDLYHKNWKTNNATFSISTSSLATGTIYIDDVIFAPMTFVNGAWLAIVGGTTPFSRNDTFTLADTVNATRGILSYWIHHRSGLCLAEPGFGLPVNASGTETEADPS